MFTLDQKMFIVQWRRCSEMENDLRTANGPIRHLEFLMNFNIFPDFHGTYQQLALIILFFHT
jgi:hypothetical protein